MVFLLEQYSVGIGKGVHVAHKEMYMVALSSALKMEFKSVAVGVRTNPAALSRALSVSEHRRL